MYVHAPSANAKRRISRSRCAGQPAGLAGPAVEAAGCQLWDVEYVREAGSWYLRLYIDKEGGVDILDCERISREVGALLDEADPIEGSYLFEVSSGGAGQPGHQFGYLCHVLSSLCLGGDSPGFSEILPNEIRSTKRADRKVHSGLLTLAEISYHKSPENASVFFQIPGQFQEL